MNSFRLTAVGHLARNPDLSIEGETIFARFSLVGYDEVSEGEHTESREVATRLWFFAFGEIASAIALQGRKGDQLFLEARVVASHWTDRDGDKQHGHTFIVTGFRFGARRGGHGSPIAVHPNPPDKPVTDAADAAMEVAA